jgi:exopolysaccharide biosynthesis protein
MRSLRRIDSSRGFRKVTSVAAVVAIIGVESFIGASLSTIIVARYASASSATTTENGLHVYEINGRRFGVRTAIHVLTFSGSQYSVKIGLAKNTIDGGTQTTSAMCQTTAGCVAAVNGDLFALSRRGESDPGDEVGGIIQNCVLLHTPEIVHQQADLDDQSVSVGLDWSSTLDVNGINVPITAINQELPISYVRVHLPLVGTLLFTPPYALQTPSRTGWVTYEFTQVDDTISPTTINTTSELEYVAQTTEAMKVRTGQVFISAFANSTLATLQAGDIVTLATTSSAGCDNIGGHSILLDQGVVTPIVATDAYLVKPYARTVIGWTALGETVVLTVNGKDGVSGATGHQLDRLLRSLDVVTALDLDGGSSTTFYAKGRVLGRPAHGTERPVSTSLLITQDP